MLSFGTLSFTAPWLLAALAALPIIWWILRVTPPAPRRERFPAIAFLFGAEKHDETPAHTPLWLLILRLLIAALIILGLAGPLLNARGLASVPGPLTLIIDNGWPSARNWERIQSSAISLADEAERAGKTVTLVRTAPAAAQSFAPIAAARAKALLKAMEPQPWRPGRAEVLAAWQASPDVPKSGRVVWLSDGIAGPDGKDFAQSLAGARGYEVLVPAAKDMPVAIRPAQSGTDTLSVTLLRPEASARQDGSLTAYGEGGHVVARESFSFAPGAVMATADFKLPLEMRNEILRIEIDGGRSAGAVTLLDDRWHRRAAGLVSGGAFESAQPLLGDLYYVERALQPYADIRKGPIGDLIDGHISVLILADVGRIVDDDISKLSSWVESGGVLIRFAGPRLAGQSDELVPVALRKGGRVIGGALSWAEPQQLGDFEQSSPFFGLAPPKDVTVRRQVLAEPSLELTARTWARLADGTPLVTAVERGKGHIVLFHVTANSDWSSLPLSGLFVDMLERLIDLSKASAMATRSAGASEAALTPRQTLDGYGVLKTAPALAQPISIADLATLAPGPRHPPGLYGPHEALRALNATRDNDILRSLTEFPQGASVSAYAAERVTRLGPWLLVAALTLALLDGLIALLLMGKLSLPRPATRAAVLIALGAFLPLGDHAAAEDAALLDAALNTHLAYVVTGDSSIDAMSRAGLEGLSERLAAKTALEPAKPIGLDVEKDDITLFPLIYWPVTEAQKPLSPNADRKLDQYLKAGGMILFDTRDQDRAAGNPSAQTPAGAALQRLMQGLDIPPLEPVPDSHVLTRSFYLLSDFPGRFAGGRVWVEAGAGPDAEGEAREGAVNDGVSSVIIGSNDWASAWAVDANGRSIAAVIPGGNRQREMAYRFGINLAMYALTGNYKGDEVHTRELIKRLGE